MKKNLHIDLYADGFDATHLNCVDLPIAGATGYYNYENYFYYCFCHCMSSNWNNTQNTDWFSSRNELLGKLGLCIKPIAVDGPSSLISAIKAQIDSQHPLLMLCKYYTLFYHVGYLDDEFLHIGHGIVINGYDAEKSLISVKEYSHIETDIKAIVKSYLLFDLPLTEDLLKDIWVKSNEIFKQEYDNSTYATIYSIEKMGEPQITSYSDLLEYFFGSVDFRHDKLVEFIKNYNNHFEEIRTLSHASELRKAYVNSLTILFDVFERAFGFLKQNQEIQWKYDNIKDMYLQTRSSILNKLIANALRGKTIGEDTEQHLIDQVTLANKELFSFIENLHKNRAVIERNSSSYSFSPVGQVQVRDGQYADTVLTPTYLLITQNFPEEDRNWEVFLKFDFSSLDFESCLSASLKLYCNFAQIPTPFEVYPVPDDSWSGTEMTWNTRPVISEAPIVTQTIKTQKVWYSFDVTAFVKERLLSNKTISLCLRIEPEANVGANFFSTYAAYNRPVLEIVPVRDS